MQLSGWWYRGFHFLPCSDAEVTGILWCLPREGQTEAEWGKFKGKFDAKTYVDDVLRVPVRAR